MALTPWNRQEEWYKEMIDAFSSGASVPEYQGSYTVTPSEEPQLLSTKDMKMNDNVTVYAIPSQYIIPSGTLSIIENGTGIDVSAYCSVDVNVSHVDYSTGIIDRSVESIESPASVIGMYAFAYCSSLRTASFPECNSIKSSAFFSCESLANISFPNCTDIDFSAFNACPALLEATFPECINMASSAFAGCSSLSLANFPKCTIIQSGTFKSCINLTNISFPECTTIGSQAFTSCTALSTASFPKCENILGNAFSNCTNLVSLYLMGSSVALLGAKTAFASTPISGISGVYGSIYVPSSLYNSYILASNWSFYSDRFVSV